MKIALLVCAALLVACAAPVSVHCQGDSIVDDMKTIGGDVLSVDVPNSQVVVKSAEAMTFSVPSGAQIVDADGFGIQLSDVSAGNYVTVGYHDDGSGNHIMDSMEVDYSNT